MPLVECDNSGSSWCLLFFFGRSHDAPHISPAIWANHMSWGRCAALRANRHGLWSEPIMGSALTGPRIGLLSFWDCHATNLRTVGASEKNGGQCKRQSERLGSLVDFPRLDPGFQHSMAFVASGDSTNKGFRHQPACANDSCHHAFSKQQILANGDNYSDL